MTDYVHVAEAHGAKFDRADNGMWRILDQPGTVLWWAFFLDQRTAACAYCMHHRLRLTPWAKEASEPTLPPKFLADKLGHPSVSDDPSLMALQEYLDEVACRVDQLIANYHS